MLGGVLYHRGFRRGRSAARRLSFVVSASVIALAGLSVAASAAGPFSWDGYEWEVDRHDTAAQEVGSFFGRDNVLHLTTDKENLSSPFYAYEGYSAPTGLPVGSSFVSGSIYIPGDWQTNAGPSKEVRAGLWPVIGNPADHPAGKSYPIVEFYNGGAAGEIRVYDQTDWKYFPTAPIEYDAWNTFRVNYVATPGGPSAEIYVNGTLVTTLSQLGDDGYLVPPEEPIDTSTNGLYSLILNSRTNSTTSYDVYWSSILASMREEYFSAASVAPTAIASGDMLLGTYVDRRGLDWDGQKAAWMHAVGGVSSFDNGNGTVESSVGGVQFGIDLVTLGDPSTRAGVTFGYSGASSSISLPSGIDGGDTSNSSPSVGAYLTHASGSFYADLLGQYRFLDFNVNAPTSTGSVKGGSLDVAAEVGTHFAISDVFSLTPFVQLTYQHLTLDDTTLGGMATSFGKSDALIARARVLAEARNGAFSLFASAGVSDDLLDDKESTVALTTLESSIGGPRAEFTAGIEGRAANGFSIYGSGEYNVSFDGNSHAYLGRAGIRKDF